MISRLEVAERANVPPFAMDLPVAVTARQRTLARAGVALAPGVGVDTVVGGRFVRVGFVGSATDVTEGRGGSRTVF
ncbi:MAG: hypothetical protein FWE71_00225 [Nocardioidaceae bacterium]|nr:hypothetical protein [Nocardioidaceae bacterium]MCL2612788.1 hypothetical protein [Nocardioidaceae bacterium]